MAVVSMEPAGCMPGEVAEVEPPAAPEPAAVPVEDLCEVEVEAAGGL